MYLEGVVASVAAGSKELAFKQSMQISVSVAFCIIVCILWCVFIETDFFTFIYLILITKWHVFPTQPVSKRNTRPHGVSVAYETKRKRLQDFSDILSPSH